MEFLGLIGATLELIWEYLGIWLSSSGLWFLTFAWMLFWSPWAYDIGKKAERKGRKFSSYFFFSLAVTPLVTWVLVNQMTTEKPIEDPRGRIAKAQRNAELERQRWQTDATDASTPKTPNQSNASTDKTSSADALKRVELLKELFDSGALTQEEFEREKAKALGNI